MNSHNFISPYYVEFIICKEMADGKNPSQEE